MSFLMRTVGMLLLGGTAGALLGAVLTALISIALGVLIGGLLGFLTTPYDPTGIFAFPILLVLYSPPFGTITGALAGAGSLVSGTLKVGIGLAALSALIAPAVLCTEPNFYGGLELGSLEYCIVPGIVVGGVAILAAVLASALILEAQRVWQSRQARSK